MGDNRDMEGVGKYGGGEGKCVWVWEEVLGVWESEEECMGECGEVCGSPHTLLHFPHTSPHRLTHSTPLSTLT